MLRTGYEEGEAWDEIHLFLETGVIVNLLYIILGKSIADTLVSEIFSNRPSLSTFLYLKYKPANIHSLIHHLKNSKFTGPDVAMKLFHARESPILWR